jgi:O-antigen ligase
VESIRRVSIRHARPEIGSPSGQTDGAVRVIGAGEPPVGRDAPVPGGRVPVALLLALMALTMACLGAGFWPRSQLAIGVTLALTALVGARSLVTTLAVRGHRLLLAALGALAAYAALRAAVAGDVRGATGIVALLAGVTIVFATVAGRSDADRALALRALSALGAVVSLTGLVGVAFHLEPLVTHDPSGWRAASILTYPNATAALLVMLVLPAAGRYLTVPTDRITAGVIVVLLTGGLATMSRGGALALAVAATLWVVLARPGRRLVVLAAPGVGTVVAVAGLLPALDPGADPAPARVLGALAAGVAVAALLAPVVAAAAPPPRRAGAGTPVRGLAVAGALVVLAAVAVAASVATFGAGGIGAPPGPDASALDRRLSPESSDRADGLRAAFDEIKQHPVVGRGPGESGLRWTRADPDGSATTMYLRFVHDEYVQVLVELGAVGIALLATVLATIAWLLGRARATAESPQVWAAITAALAALAVHSSLDFLWHLPLLPLTAAALAAAAFRPQGEPT